MRFLYPKTLSPSPFLQLPRTGPPNLRRVSPVNGVVCKSEYRTERCLDFDIGETFFRRESATGRDLAVLAAAVYKKSKGELRVLDAMCGCGIRSLRYLAEAEADSVLANDANDEYRRVILSNLSQVPRVSGDDKRWTVTHFDANRLMTECYLQKDYFDLIDVDSFGSDSTFLRSALNALKLDGLLYVTSTDGYSSGGHRPYHALASYGAYVCPVPYSNEVGLRMLIGGAVREASVLGYHVAPLFSYYSYHGPVFRVMLRFNRGKLPNTRHYGFLGYCTRCGHSRAFSWDELGCTTCPCDEAKTWEERRRGIKEKIVNTLKSFNYQVSGSRVIGPLWTGPLHNTTYMIEMLDLSRRWGWTSNGMGLDLEKLLTRMIDESDPELPAGYIKLDEVARRAKVNSPPIRAMISTIQKEGYAASRSHIASNAIKTNCPMAGCVSIAKELNSAE